METYLEWEKSQKVGYKGCDDTFNLEDQVLELCLYPSREIVTIRPPCPVVRVPGKLFPWVDDDEPLVGWTKLMFDWEAKMVLKELKKKIKDLQRQLKSDPKSLMVGSIFGGDRYL